MSPSAPPPAQNLDLELLRTFVAVAAQGTFAEAGKHLDRSQSGITHQMQRLEAQVGVTLFHKSGRNKQLTHHGRLLLRYARDLLALNDDTLRALRETDAAGVLRIGSPHDVADTILPQVLNRLSRYMPQVNLETTVGRSPQLMSALHRGEIDLAISTRADASLEGFVLRASPTVWLCAANFTLVPNQPIPLILGDEHSVFRRYALEALERAQLPWRQVYSSSSPMGIKAALRGGLGITARSLELIGPDIRLLGERDGFPALPEIVYHLWMRPHSINPLVRQAYTLLHDSNERYGNALDATTPAPKRTNT